MAELYQQEKLQPSLLDRLTDHSLQKISDFHEDESDVVSTRAATQGRFTISSRQLRELVVRDIAWLLNSSSLDCVQELDTFPYCAASVINYGVPALTGAAIANIEPHVLERKIKKTIQHFESRIIADTVQVHIEKKDAMSNRALNFTIECDIWGQPAPEHLLINSEIDLESGSVQLV